MNYLKILMLTLFTSCVLNTNAQNVPPELLGKWEIMNIYTVDTAGVSDSVMNATVYNMAVTSNTIEYEFVDTNFSLIVNNQLLGSCNFQLDTMSNVVLTNIPKSIEDFIYKFKSVSITSTDLEVVVCNPDGDNPIIMHQFLTKEP